MGNQPIACGCEAVEQEAKVHGADDMNEIPAVDMGSFAPQQQARPEVPQKRRRTMGRSNSLSFARGDGQELSSRPPSEKTTEEKEMLATSLRGNPKLRRLANFDEEHIAMLVSTAHKEVFETGELIMAEGDLDNKTFYVTASGKVQISSTEPFKVVRREDGHGDLAPVETPPSWKRNISGEDTTPNRATEIVGRLVSLGVSTMMNRTPRKTTIVAVERCELWVFSEASVKIVADMAQEASHSIKSEEDVKLISEVLEANGNFQGLVPLRSRHVKLLAQVAFGEELAEGQVIMREGDLNADAFYMVGDGMLEITSSEPFQVISSQGKFHLARGEGTASAECGEGTTRQCGKGLSLGELSMLYCAPRWATVTAMQKTKLWAIARSDFQAIQKQAVEEHIRGRVRTLETLSVLSSFSTRDKERFAGVLEKMLFREGDVLYREGDMGTALYIVYEGSVAITCSSKPDESFQAKPVSGSYDYRYFGESALMDTMPQPREETVCVTSPKAAALVLEQEELHKIWDRLIAEPPSAFERYKTGAVKEKHQEELALSWENLEKVGLLGCGALGPVELVKHKTSKAFYALKTMSKGLIVQRGLRQSVVQERTLWMKVLSPFVVRVFATLADTQSLCFLLEPALGGSLASTYPKHRLYGQVEHVRYHTAGVVLALEHLHKRNIVYRNIKPESVVLSHLGHPRLTDMSLAKIVYGHTFTTCGTPNYMAPEVISAVGHTRGADWWSLGVLIFELMAGKSPFDAERPMTTYLKVMQGMSKMEVPEACAGPVRDLVENLLLPDPVDRLAMRKGGLQNVMDHAWFSGFDWKAMRDLSLAPPYTPAFPRGAKGKLTLEELQKEALLSHFSSSSSDLPRPVEYVADMNDEWDLEFASS